MMLRLMAVALTTGWTLHIYDSNMKPLNGPPWHLFATQAECEADLDLLRVLDADVMRCLPPTQGGRSRSGGSGPRR